MQKTHNYYPEGGIHNLAVEVKKHLRLPSSKTYVLLFPTNIHYTIINALLQLCFHILNTILGSKDCLKFNLRKIVLETSILSPALSIWY